MHRWIRLATALLLAGVLLAACSNPSTTDLGSEVALGETAGALSAPAGSPIADRYIVVFRDGVASGRALAAQMVRGAGGELHFTYEHALNGFAATLPPQAVAGISRNPNVAYVEQDSVATLHDVSTTQSNATWGLDRIDQRALPLDSTYTYAYTGTGVTAFVIDSGIQMEHDDFGNRAVLGFDAFPGDGLLGGDCNGHGTHVAGTLGGSTWGVAKDVTLVSVRVFTCSGGTAISTVISGIEYVTSQSSTAIPAVVNMSLGGGYAQSLNDAVTASVAAGFVYAVSAGNDGRDACSFSPASTPHALTVGATERNDDRARYSNVGDCVDIFAPGTGITSAWIGGTTATRAISGTSMASPHVAGVAALLLQQDPTATPAAIAAAITGGATQGVVNRARSANAHLLYAPVKLAGDGDGTGPGDGDEGGGGNGGDPTDMPPTIGTVTITNISTGPWTRYEVAWSVADDTALASVIVEAVSGNTVVDSVSVAVSGTSANGTTAVRNRGTITEIRVTVADAAGNQSTQAFVLP